MNTCSTAVCVATAITLQISSSFTYSIATYPGILDYMEEEDKESLQTKAMIILC